MLRRLSDDLSQVAQGHESLLRNVRETCRRCIGLEAMSQAAPLGLVGAIEAQTSFYRFKTVAAVPAMAAMWILLSTFLCISTVSGAEDVCATCAPSPPAQSAALLQSSVQRHAKTAGGPHVFNRAQLFVPDPMGRHASHMGRMGPRMGPRMSQPHYNFALRHAREKQRRAESSQESLYESLYASGEITPCQEPTSWTPDKDIYGWGGTHHAGAA
eukprot:Skav216224  [mRNA]  locus=scaffold238:380560:381535:+ [translate_table: standard]